MPKEYGGEAGTIAELAGMNSFCILGIFKLNDLFLELFKQRLESYRDWFIEDSKFGVDETKRRGKPQIYSDIFGVEGSFKQLNVD